GPSAPSAPPPLSLGAELKDVFKVFRSQEIPAYKTFVQREPILRAAQPYALQQLKNLGLYQPTLQKVFQTQLAPVMLSGGALTPGQRTAAEQQALCLSARAGMATGPQGIAGALLGTEAARQARFNTALTQGMALASGIQGLGAEALRSAYGGELAQTGAFSGLISPLTSMAQDIYSTNYNAQAAANIQGANASAGGKRGMKGF